MPQAPDFIPYQPESKTPDFIPVGGQAPDWTSEKQAFANPPVSGPNTSVPGSTFGGGANIPQGMQEAMAPKAVRMGANTLPAVGGIAGSLGGAALGAETGGIAAFAGAPVGAGIGSGAGNTARQAILTKVLSDKDVPAPFSKAGLTESAIAAGIGAALEIPAGVMQGYGSVLLKRLANAADAHQVGDVVQAFKEVAPKGLTQQGLKSGLQESQAQLSGKLSKALSSTQGTADLDALLAQARQEAATHDAMFARVKPSGKVTSTTKVSQMLEDVISAAKINAGIKNNSIVSAQQLADFQRQIQNVAFKSAQANPTVGGVVKGLERSAYGNIGQQIRVMAPETDQILSKMSDIHAAINSLDNYNMGKTGAAAVTAATHPLTNAVVSPAVAFAAKKPLENAAEYGYGALRGLVR